ncbi:MAG: hypothetical protein IKZ39_07845, partial [Lachnospiraceae bacterium]|nr:hypothetical protein [Lachnospiraceae bacterium]
LYALAEVSPNAPRNPVVKWYNVKMSYEEKYRFGHISYEEYCAWMYELMNSPQEPQDDAAEGSGEGNAYTASSSGNTFWQGDQEKRNNLSSNDYNDFLSSNSVDVSNRNTVDFDKLASEVNNSAPAAEAAPPPSADTNLDEVLANVNKDMHGGDAILSQEEIEALFAQANGG